MVVSQPCPDRAIKWQLFAVSFPKPELQEATPFQSLALSFKWRGATVLRCNGKISTGADAVMIEAVLAALAIAATEPQKAEAKGDPARWVRARDLPAISADAAVTTFDLTIDEAGKPVACAIIVSSGRDDLDQAVCSAVSKRARFKPASDSNGSNVYLVRRDRVIWTPQVRSGNKSYDAADLVIKTPELRAGAEILVDVLLSMTENGDVSQCKVAESSDDIKLDQLACEAATNPQIALPVTDETGRKVAGIRSLFVTFESGATMSVKLR
jgi:hypothetical protein